MHNNLYIQESATSTTHLSTQKADIAHSNTVSGLLAILLPTVALGAIAIYRKHQARMMRQQIQRLNRIWQLNSSETLS
jgi:hypothetical protein